MKLFTILNLFWTLNCDFNEMSHSKLAQVNNTTVHIRCKGLSSFYFLPQVNLWFVLWHYHYSNKQTVKYSFISLYNRTVHCTIRNKAKSVRRQHRKGTSEASEILTYKGTTQVVRNRWVSFIHTRSLGRMVHMLKRLVIYLLS